MWEEFYEYLIYIHLVLLHNDFQLGNPFIQNRENKKMQGRCDELNEKKYWHMKIIYNIISIKKENIKFNLLPMRYEFRC